MSEFNFNNYRFQNNQSADNESSEKKAYTYFQALELVRDNLTTNHSKELAKILDDESRETEAYIKKLISDYIIKLKLNINSECKTISELVDKMYEDMAGIGHLKKYLDDPFVEEINCNSWNNVEIVTPEGWQEIEPFADKQSCVDITKKMCRIGGLILNEAKPYGDSFIKEGVRISAMMPPIVDDITGATFSIRKQSTKTFSIEDYIKYNVATRDELDFLSLCVRNNISVAFAGNTGSGKTADMSVILNTVPNGYRIFVIEDSRELNLAKYDENGKVINRVVQTKTYQGEGNRQVTMLDLLKIALRYHPRIIVPAEMRGEEALTATETGRTGHTIVTSLHARSAVDGYTRILTMCTQAKTNLTEDMLLRNIVEAYPIMVYKEQLDDMTRKIMTIFQAERVENKCVIGRTLFQFIVTENVYEGDRIKKVIGEHQQIDYISDELAERLFSSGARVEEIKRFAAPAWSPAIISKNSIKSQSSGKVVKMG